MIVGEFLNQYYESYFIGLSSTLMPLLQHPPLISMNKRSHDNIELLRILHNGHTVAQNVVLFTI